MEGVNVTFFRENKSTFFGLPTWLFVLISSFLISTCYAFILLHFFDFNVYPDYYDILARNLLEGKGYIIGFGEDSVFWRPPLYPLFLVPIYYFFGYQHFPVVVIQVILNSLTAVLIYKIMKKIFSPSLGLFAGILYSLYPLVAYNLPRVSTVILFNFLFVLLIIVMYQFYDTPNWRNAVIFGGIQGLLTLCQLFFEGFPIFILLSIFIMTLFHCRKGIMKQVQFGLWMILGFSIVLAPWVIRNYKLSGVFPLLGVGGGYTMWYGNYMQTEGKDFNQLSSREGEEFRKELKRIIGREDGSSITIKNDKKLYKEAVHNFIRYPKETVLLMLKKVFRLWFSVYSFEMQKYQWMISVVQAIIIFPGIYGVYRALKKGIRIGPLLLVILYFQIVYTVFNASIRYSLPVMFIIISLALYGIVEAYRNLSIKPLRGDYDHR